MNPNEQLNKHLRYLKIAMGFSLVLTLLNSTIFIIEVRSHGFLWRHLINFIMLGVYISLYIKTRKIRLVIRRNQNLIDYYSGNVTAYRLHSFQFDDN
jgi:hypothetical protein